MKKEMDFGKQSDIFSAIENLIKKDKESVMRKTSQVGESGSVVATIEYLRRSATSGFSKKYIVTPEDATYILKKYAWINRNIAMERVLSYARLMSEGEFLVNGEMIKVGRIKEEKNRPILFDGTHRLNGVITSNVPIELEFYFYDPKSLDENTRIQRTLDGGRIRTLSNKFHMENIPSSSAVVAIIRHLLKYYDLGYPFIGAEVCRSNKSLTDKKCFEFYYNHPEEIAKAVSVLGKLKTAKFTQPSIIGALYYHYRFKLGDTKIDKFLESVTSGANLHPRSVELELNQYIRLYRGNSNYKTSNITELMRNVACNMAFQHVHERKDVGFSKFSSKRIKNWVANLGTPEAFKLLPHLP